MTAPTILIIGGKDKGNDYDPIKDLVKEQFVDDDAKHDGSVLS